MQLPKYTRRTRKTLLIALLVAVAVPAGWISYVRTTIESRLEDLKSDDAARSAAAAKELSRCRSGPSVRVIVSALDDETQNRQRLIAVIGHLGRPAVAPLLERLRRNPRSLVERIRKDTSPKGALAARVEESTALAEKDAVVSALGAIGETAIAPLVRILKSDDPGARQFAAAALSRIRKPATQALLDALSNKDPLVRLWVLGGLAVLEDPRGPDAVIARLEDHSEDLRVRIVAAHLLGNSRSPRAFEALTSVLDDRGPRLVEHAELAIIDVVNPDGPVTHEKALAAIAAHKNANVVNGLIGALWFEMVTERPDSFILVVEALIAINDPQTTDLLTRAVANRLRPSATTDYHAAALEICGKSNGRSAVDAALGKGNIDWAIGNYRAIVKNGSDSRSRALLVTALERSGDAAMARCFVDSGDPWLAEIARFWARRKGVTLESTGTAEALPEAPAIDTTAPTGPHVRIIDDFLPAEQGN